MTAEIPVGIAIEDVFLVEVPYTNEARDRRGGLRREHLTRIAKLRAEGRIIEAGGCADFSKAVLLVRASSEADALALIAADAYTAGGVWHAPTARRFGRVATGG
jgi:uncharacterized protein YciI